MKYYEDSELVLTDLGRENIIRQNSGMAYAVCGAILFQNKKTDETTPYIEKKLDDKKLKEISLKDLIENTNPIFNLYDSEYSYSNFSTNGTISIDKDIKEKIYSEIENSNLSYFFQINTDFTKSQTDDRGLRYYIRINKNTLKGLPLNNDYLFDGLVLLAKPYKVVDKKCVIERNTIPEIFSISYYKKDKLKILKNNSNIISMNAGIEFILMDEEDISIKIENILNKEIYNAIHIIDKDDNGHTYGTDRNFCISDYEV